MTERQENILAAIIEEYAEVASPVGSMVLARAFDVSSATIRAEMVRLEELGFIMQPHTSAGRVPTDKGYRFYVNNIRDKALEMDPDTSRMTHVINKRVINAGEADQAIKLAVDSLVKMTDNLGIATIGPTLYMSGLSHLFRQPEFLSGSVRDVADLLDNLEPWLREAAPNKPLSVFIGRENPIGGGSGCSLIISRYRSHYSDQSYIGVLGPTRQSYKQVMNMVQDAGRILERTLV